MVTTKSTVNVKVGADIKEPASQISAVRELTLDEQLLAVIKAKNIPHVTLECDENGNVIIDKDKHPELYDWAVNG